MKRRNMLKTGVLLSVTPSALLKLITEESSVSLFSKQIHKYANQYVATPSFEDHDVVSYHKDPIEAIRLAEARGYKDPQITYIREPGTKCITSFWRQH